MKQGRGYTLNGMRSNDVDFPHKTICCCQHIVGSMQQNSHFGPSDHRLTGALFDQVPNLISRIYVCVIHPL